MVTLSKRRRVRIKPLPVYPKQRDFRTSNAFVRGFVAGRASGKTRIGAVDICMRALKGESWMAVSPDSSVIEETTWPTFKEVAKELGVWIRGVRSPYPKAWIHARNGGTAEVVFRSGEKPEKLRGPSKAGLWLDEASVMKEEVFQIGLAVLRHKGQLGKCLMTFTPKGRQHWTFRQFFDQVDPERLGEMQEAHGPRIVEHAGQYYLIRDNRSLTHASSAENPFLHDEYVENIRGAYSALFARQELGGEFVDISGLMFDRTDFQFCKPAEVPRNALRVRYWDRAATHGGGSYSAGVLMCRTADNRYIIEHVVRGQWSYRERDKVIEQTAEQDAAKYGNEVLIYVEQEGGSGGKEVANQMVINLGGFPVYRDIVSGQRVRRQDNIQLPGSAKIVRAMSLSAQVEAQNVYLVYGAWNPDFLEEMVAFPESSFTDQVDGASGSFNKLAGRGLMDPGPIERIDTSTENLGARLIELQASMRR